MKKVKIMSNGKFIEYAQNREAAEQRIATYERMDRYEVEVEGYGFPNGLPVYTIEE